MSHVQSLRARLLWMVGIIALILPANRLHAAPQYKLSGVMVAGGDVNSLNVRFSPDSLNVLYGADQLTDGLNELFIVDSGSVGAEIKLNGTLVAGGGVILNPPSLFSPDSSRVLYFADQDTDDVLEIYSVPITGGTPTKLNGTLVTEGDVNSFYQFSPDSSRVLYQADQDTNNVFEIYSVPSGGGAAIKLNAPLVAGGNVENGGLQFSPNSSRVLYRADQDTDDVFEIYSVPGTGGAAVKLNGALVAGGGVSQNGLQFSSDSSRVLYVADQDVSNVNEVFSVPSTGGLPVKLNGALVAGGDVVSNGVRFSPDGSRAFYLADQLADDVFELFSVPSTGGGAVKISGTLATGGDVQAAGLQFSPNGSRVVYRADQQTDNVVELYSVPATGGAAVKISGPLVSGGDVDSANLRVSPDSSRVIFLADKQTDGVNELFSVPITGGTPVKLNAPLVAGGEVTVAGNGAVFTPDGNRVMYLADQDIDDVLEAYIVPSAGGVAVKLNSTLPSGRTLLDGSVQISPDGTRMIYAADQSTNDVFELYGRVIKQSWSNDPGSFDTFSNWSRSQTPDEAIESIIDIGTIATATGFNGREVFSLRVGTGGVGGTSVLQLASDADMVVYNGTTIVTGGILRGDGTVTSSVVNNGLVQTAAGQQLHFVGATFANRGLIGLDGAPGNPAEMTFTNAVTNETPGGTIAASSAILRFNGGLKNNDEIGLNGGTIEVFGAVENDGSIVVKGGATATFHGSVIQSGTFEVQSGSSAIFLGDVTGAGGGTGGGDIFFEGMFHPGKSPGEVPFENTVYFGDDARLAIELGGPTLGDDYDSLSVDGSVKPDGTLSVTLIDLGGGIFAPDLGQSFNIITTTDDVIGTFDDEDLPGLHGGLKFDVLYGVDRVVLEVIGVLGDYNLNGVVDTADYVVWRNTINASGANLAADGNGDGQVDEDDYKVWQQNFGLTAGSGAGAIADSATTAVPEPTTAILILMVAALVQRRQIDCRRNKKPWAKSPRADSFG